MELYIRPAQLDEITLVLQLLKESARWLQKEHMDGWQDWLNPPFTSVDSIRQGFQQSEFHLVYYGCELAGCFRLQWKDEIFPKGRIAPAEYIHSLTTAHKFADPYWTERILALIETYCAERQEKTSASGRQKSNRADSQPNFQIPI